MCVVERNASSAPALAFWPDGWHTANNASPLSITPVAAVPVNQVITNDDNRGQKAGDLGCQKRNIDFEQHLTCGNPLADINSRLEAATVETDGIDAYVDQYTDAIC